MAATIRDMLASARYWFAVLEQDEVWIDRYRVRHQLDDMTLRYKLNVLNWLERRGSWLAERYYWGEITTVLDGPAGPNPGGLAYESLEMAIEQELIARRADPRGWIHVTKLGSRLVRDLNLRLGGTDDGTSQESTWTGECERCDVCRTLLETSYIGCNGQCPECFPQVPDPLSDSG